MSSSHNSHSLRSSNSIIIIFFIQQWKNRHYTHCGIKLKLIVVDALKRWNIRNPVIGYDVKFVRMLLLDIFGTKLLKNSTTINALDAEKIRFIRGN